MSNRRRFLGEIVGGAATVALSGVLNSRQTLGASDRMGSAQAYTRLGNLTSWSASENTVQFKCDGGAMVALTIATPEMMRVRVAPDGNFAESLSIKLGFVKDDWLAPPFQTRQTDDAVWVETGALKIKAAKQPFRLSFFDGQDKPLLKECDTPGMGYRQEGNELRVEMAPDEHFYGLGFNRKSLDVRGTKLAWKRTFRNLEATVGFFLSTRGYGFYTNNTFHHISTSRRKKAPPTTTRSRPKAGNWTITLFMGHASARSSGATPISQGNRGRFRAGRWGFSTSAVVTPTRKRFSPWLAASASATSRST